MPEVQDDPGTEADVERLRADCRQFRILVIGKANAGKTTILQKVCNVEPGAKPIVFNRDGKKISSSWFKKASAARGEHNIEHQITYQGCNFIFHDSRGFEAGSQNELKTVREFIAERSRRLELKDQLHAIWYCIPMDDSHPLSPAEMSFFAEGTGRVPVIVIFTKYDAQVTQAATILRQRRDLDVQQAWAQAPIDADIIFRREYLSRVLESDYPPKAHVRLQDMNNPQQQCPELTDQTAKSIDNDILSHLFVSVQMNNLHLCIQDAIDLALNCYTEGTTMTHVDIAEVGRSFPHFWNVSIYEIIRKMGLIGISMI